MKLDTTYVKRFIKEDIYESTKKDVLNAYQSLMEGTIQGNEALGWLKGNPLKQETIDSILETAETLQKSVDILVVIGIGGSYLGTKAALDALTPYFKPSKVEIIFAGHQLSGSYLEALIEMLKDKKFAINVISKSGTTTEPALAFRLLRRLLEDQVGKKKAQSLIIATTDPENGALRTLANQENYQTYDVPSDIGGRFSVFSAVGILPLAVAGIDVQAFLNGAKDTADLLKKEPKDAVEYATTRQSLYRIGKKLEILVHYEPKLAFTAEWWKQLFGESEGKEEKGLYVASAGFSTDLHSLGQMIQEGEKLFFETVVSIKTPLSSIRVPMDEKNLDGLNYLADESLETINETARIATRLAHVDGNVPNIHIEMETLDAYHYGQLLYFFCFTVAISGAASGVNPFNQPGVEAYKVNMFALLGKPGFESLKETLLKK
jgi:glucose-6-phosphate isomerase